jgi:hypothetical protein
MVIKEFEEYIEEGIVKRISPDIQRAESLILETNKKFHFLNKMINSFGIKDINSNEYIEYCYNIIMFLIRAEMFKKGFSSSGKGAHEAEVAFSRKIGLTEYEIQLLDQLRYFRNGILYYGKQFDKEYAEKIINFTKEIKIKLNN